MKKPDIAYTGLFSYYMLWFLAMAFSGMLNLYLSNSGYSVKEITYLLSLAPICALLLQTTMAKFADKSRDLRLLVALVSLAYTAMYVLIPVSRSFAWLFVIMLAHAVLNAANHPASTSLVLRSTGYFGKSFTPVRLAASIAYAVGSYLAGWVIKANTNSIFIPVVALNLLSIASLFLLPKEINAKGERMKREKLSYVAILKNRPLMMATGVVFLTSIAAWFHQSWFNIYLKQSGMPEDKIGLVVAIGILFEIPAFLVIDKVIRRFGERKVMIFSSMSFVVFLFLIAWSAGGWLTYAAQALAGIKYVGLQYTGIILVNRVTPDNMRTMGQGFFATATASLPSVIMMLMTNIFEGGAGLGGLYWAMGFMVLAAGLLYMFLTRKDGDIQIVN